MVLVVSITPVMFTDTNGYIALPILLGSMLVFGIGSAVASTLTQAAIHGWDFSEFDRREVLKAGVIGAIAGAGFAVFGGLSALTLTGFIEAYTIGWVAAEGIFLFGNLLTSMHDQDYYMPEYNQDSTCEKTNAETRARAYQIIDFGSAFLGPFSSGIAEKIVEEDLLRFHQNTCRYD
jgi:hypothetical protein